MCERSTTKPKTTPSAGRHGRWSPPRSPRLRRDLIHHYRAGMLTSGFNHIGMLTNDTDRLVEFYEAVFEAEVFTRIDPEPGMRLTMVRIGELAELNVFELDGNTEADRQTPMFGRGRLDHVAFEAPSLDA